MSTVDLVQPCLQKGQHLGPFPKREQPADLGGSVLPWEGSLAQLSWHKCFPGVNIPELPQGQGSAHCLSRCSQEGSEERAVP